MEQDRGNNQHIVSDEELRNSIPEQSNQVKQERSNTASSQGESDDSHYSSSEQGTESTTKVPAPSTSEEDGASSLDSDSGEDEEGSGSSTEESVSSMINFLREKQSLLQRASEHFAREEAYNAFNAVYDSKVTTASSMKESAVWSEAKKFLKEEASGVSPSESAASESGDSEDDGKNKRKRSFMTVTSTLAPSPTGGASVVILKSSPSPCSKEIDTSQVKHITSKAFEEESKQATPSLCRFNTVDVMFRQGNWMAKALLMSTSNSGSASSAEESSSGKVNKDWEVISDPQTCALGLLPPRDISLHDSVTLQDAMAITTEPQLVTQATYPFTVVSANKAFCQLAGILSTNKIIGQPIESILQLSQDIAIKNTEQKSFQSFPSVMWIKGGDNKSGSNIKSCNLQVKPVVNQAIKRRRINDMSSLPNTYLSHLLVVLQEASASKHAPVAFGTVG